MGHWDRANSYVTIYFKIPLSGWPSAPNKVNVPNSFTKKSHPGHTFPSSPSLISESSFQFTALSICLAAGGHAWVLSPFLPLHIQPISIYFWLHFLTLFPIWPLLSASTAICPNLSSHLNILTGFSHTLGLQMVSKQSFRKVNPFRTLHWKENPKSLQGPQGPV